MPKFKGKRNHKNTLDTTVHQKELPVSSFSMFTSINYDELPPQKSTEFFESCLKNQTSESMSETSCLNRKGLSQYSKVLTSENSVKSSGIWSSKATSSGNTNRKGKCKIMDTKITNMYGLDSDDETTENVILNYAAIENSSFELLKDHETHKGLSRCKKWILHVKIWLYTKVHSLNYCIFRREVFINPRNTICVCFPALVTFLLVLPLIYLGYHKTKHENENGFFFLPISDHNHLKEILKNLYQMSESSIIQDDFDSINKKISEIFTANSQKGHQKKISDYNYLRDVLKDLYETNERQLPQDNFEKIKKNILEILSLFPQNEYPNKIPSDTSCVSRQEFFRELSAISKEMTKHVSLLNKNIKYKSSPSWSNNYREVKNIIEEALMKYSADKTGMTDYALESAGGSVVNARSSETYSKRTGLVSVFGIPLWYNTNSPRIVIQPGVNPGECWAFKGGQGHLVIQLSTVINPTVFSFEHIPKSLSLFGSINSAPCDFSVYGLTDEKSTDEIFLGKYSYDKNGKSLQYFPVQVKSPHPILLVNLKILSNHGNKEYTCIYRFRVHGMPVTDLS